MAGKEEDENTELSNNLTAFVCDPTSQAVIKKAISDMSIGYADAFIGELSDVFEYLKNKRSPRLLLVDVSNTDLPMVEVDKIMSLCTPDTKILVVGHNNDVDLFRNLLRIGVQNYIVKPIIGDDIRDHIERALNGDSPELIQKTKNGKTIAFIGANGGCGATTLATNTGWVIANTHFKRTVLIDMDFYYGNINLLLDIKAEGSFLDILESPDKIDEYFIETTLHKYGKRLFHLGGLCDIYRYLTADVEAYMTLLTELKTKFNYLVIDLPKNPTQYSREVVKTIDQFVIVCELSIASAQSAVRVIEYLEQEGIQLQHVHLVLNKVGNYVRGAISLESFEQVVNQKVLHIMQFDSAVPMGAANIGQPIASIENNLKVHFFELSKHIVDSSFISDVHKQVNLTLLDQFKKFFVDLNKVSKSQKS